MQIPVLRMLEAIAGSCGEYGLARLPVMNLDDDAAGLPQPFVAFAGEQLGLGALDVDFEDVDRVKAGFAENRHRVDRCA